MDILVIGDDNHSRATCVHWMGTFPNIEEFDLVIVAQNTLTQEIFDQMTNKLVGIRSQILTVFNTGRPVWCIVEKMMLPSPPKSGPRALYGVPPTSYDWLFVYPTVNEVPEGSSVEIVDDKFAPYLQKVKRWSLEIENVYEHEKQQASMRPVIADGIDLKPIATNKSKKMIGARVVGVDARRYGNGEICLLPKPSECDTHEAVETLIDIATGNERTEPEWRSRVEIPGLSDVEEKMSKIKREFEKNMNQLQLQWRSLDSYRDVLSVHEEPQVEAVKQVLNDLGIKTKRTQPGFPVDLIAKDIAVEVTSIAGKVDSGSPKMFQLTRFFEKHRGNEKVVLVANTFKRVHPSKRKGNQNFTPEVIEFLKLNHVCTMTSLTLLDLWYLAKTDQVEARKLLYETDGELTCKQRS